MAARLSHRGNALLFALVTLAPSPARADLERVPLRLEVEAPCSGADDFWRRIRERTQRLDPAEDGEPADAVSVTIHGESEVEGAFRITPVNAEGGSPERRVAGASCEEVTEALALALALTYDPEATSAPRPPRPEPPSPPPSRARGSAPPRDRPRGSGRRTAALDLRRARHRRRHAWGAARSRGVRGAREARASASPSERGTRAST